MCSYVGLLNGQSAIDTISSRVPTMKYLNWANCWRISQCHGQKFIPVWEVVKFKIRDATIQRTTGVSLFGVVVLCLTIWCNSLSPHEVRTWALDCTCLFFTFLRRHIMQSRYGLVVNTGRKIQTVNHTKELAWRPIGKVDSLSKSHHIFALANLRGVITEPLAVSQ